MSIMLAIAINCIFIQYKMEFIFFQCIVPIIQPLGMPGSTFCRSEYVYDKYRIQPTHKQLKRLLTLNIMIRQATRSSE